MAKWKKYYSIEVSDEGYVKTSRNPHGDYKGSMLQGYYRANVNIDGTIYCRCVHKLVAMLFMGAREEDLITHKNKNKLDNRLENLDFKGTKSKSILRETSKLYGVVPIVNEKGDMRYLSTTTTDSGNTKEWGTYPTEEAAHVVSILKSKKQIQCDCHICSQIVYKIK